MKEDTNKYQLTVVFNPKTEEKDKESSLAKIEAMVDDMGGKTAKKEKIGVKELVYKIKGQTKGEFWNLEANAAKTLNFKSLEVMLNRDANIIRYLLLKI